MMPWPDRKRIRFAAALTAALCLPGAVLADAPGEFSATLEVIRNGKVMGESTFSFENDGDTWVMSSSTCPMCSRVCKAWCPGLGSASRIRGQPYQERVQ